MTEPRVPITGSAPRHGSKIQWLAAAPPNQEVSATITIRRSPATAASPDAGEQLLSGKAPRLSREEAAQAIAADPDDMAAVHSFVQQYGLTIVEENAQLRTVRVEGTVQQMEKAFGVQLRLAQNAKGQQYLSYEGSITVPKPLAGIITAVLGLDQRPVAKHHKVKGTAAQ